MKFLILWNILLTIAFFWLSRDHKSKPPIEFSEISSSYTGQDFPHGYGYWSSKASSAGAWCEVSYREKNIDPHESSSYGVTQTANQNGSRLWVSYQDINGEKSAEGGITASSPLSDSARSGAYLELSSEGGKQWIELGFNEVGRPFLKVSGEGKEKTWWLLE